MDDLDWSAQHDELFSLFGQVMFEAQALERGLAVVLGMVYGPSPEVTTRQEIRSLVESYFTKPLGHLNHLIAGLPEVPAPLRDRLQEGVKLRNFVAHHYFWDRSGQIMTTEGRNAMLDELREHRQFFSALDSEVFDVYKRWLLSKGVAADEIEAALKRARAPEGP